MSLAVLFTLLLPFCQPNDDAIESQCVIWMANCVNLEMVLTKDFDMSAEYCIEKLPDTLLPK